MNAPERTITLTGVHPLHDEYSTIISYFSMKQKGGACPAQADLLEAFFIISTSRKRV